MTLFFNTKEDIRVAVRLRLLAATPADLPSDGTGGPLPFDIEPLEKWLYEGFARHYAQDDVRKTAFWFGVADALAEAIPPNNESKIESVKRCASLMDQIANNFGASAIQIAAMGEVLKRPVASQAYPALPRSDALTLQVALLRIFLLLSGGKTHPQLLQIESDTWANLHANLAVAPSPFDAMQSADALCVLFRAWALLRRRNPPEQAMVRGWCQSSVLGANRLIAYMQRTLTLLKSSGAYFDPAIWAALESCVSGIPNPAQVIRSGIPRFSYAIAANQLDMRALA